MKLLVALMREVYEKAFPAFIIRVQVLELKRAERGGEVLRV